MPLSIFVDALPYTEMKDHYQDWIPGMQLAQLQPNIAYSSSLHWQLYCDRYPDDRGVLVDWGMVQEKNKAVRFLSAVFTPLDATGIFAVIMKKALDRAIFQKNAFANIPFRFRKDFSEVGQYLFWDHAVYGKEMIFSGYDVISQDEMRGTLDDVLIRFNKSLDHGNSNVMLVTGFPDFIGHKVRRGEVYTARLAPEMAKLRNAINRYIELYPQEEVLLVSDHGMSTVQRKVDLGLAEKFGKQSHNTYIAYSDSCIMCIWSENHQLHSEIAAYLSSRDEGHLLSEEERQYYRATDRRFGDLIYILHEGNVFADSWFGKTLRRSDSDGKGMHGFWPERTAKDQMATIVLLSKQRNLEQFYTYQSAHCLIKKIMQGE